MFRILFSLLFWVAVGRWTYSEVKLIFPSAVPIIDFALSKLEIPTHDTWNAKAIDTFIAQANLSDGVTSSMKRAQDFIKVNAQEIKSASKTKNEAFTRF